MKHTQRLILLLAFSFSINAANAQVSNADSMIHKLFSTLKAKDEKAFVALYPSATQFPRIMRAIIEPMMKSGQMQQMMAMDSSVKKMNMDSLVDVQIKQISSPEALAEMEQKFSRSFQQIIEKGEKKGVKWNNAKIISYTMDTATSEEDEEITKATGMKNMKGIIEFQSGDTVYQMSYKEVIYMPAEGGWFGGEFPQLAKKGESLQPDEEEVYDDSKVTMPVDTTMYNPSETKTKTKTKTPTTKTKTKTKTPARKPATKS